MRLALLGSPGIGVPPRLPFRMTGAQATLLGAGATYAAVPAGNHLDLSFNGIPQTVIVTFSGAEAAQAAFHAAINAVLNLLGVPNQSGRGQAGVANSGGQSLFSAPWLGTFSGGSVLASTSAAVLASLGVAPGAFAAAVPGSVRDPLTRGFARKVGGFPIAAGNAEQHYLFVPNRGLLVLDRGVAATVSADSVRINPGNP